jgi:hypothetical protein
MFASTCFREERIEGVVTTSDGFITRHLAVWLNPMLKAEKFPARIADLHAGLTNVDADGLTHDYKEKVRIE